MWLESHYLACELSFGQLCCHYLPPQDKVAVRVPAHGPVERLRLVQVHRAGGGALAVVEHADGYHSGRLRQQFAFLREKVSLRQALFVRFIFIDKLP